MSTPSHFALDTESSISIAQRHGVGDLVTTFAHALTASSVPFTIELEGGTAHVVRTHVSKANSLAERVHERPALLLVNVADGYVSPTLYASTQEHGRAAPTWNDVSVHLHGTTTVHSDREWLLAHVRALTEAHEKDRSPTWSIDDAPAHFIEAMLGGIMGIELP